MSFDVIKYRLLPMLRQWRRNHGDNAAVSYAQCGEDLILQYLFMWLKIGPVSYLDIGAHHPTHLSNTYLFYQQGGRGVCIEPDPDLFRVFPKTRPRDTLLNCGVGIAPGEADFFVMSNNSLNTFSRAEAERYQAHGRQRIMNTIRTRLETVNEVIHQNFERAPDLISLDVEGLDYAILQSFDFATCRPAAFCVETLTYTEDRSERKLTEIIELMHANGYLTYADTYINTVFVDAAAWERRR